MHCGEAWSCEVIISHRGVNNVFILWLCVCVIFLRSKCFWNCFGQRRGCNQSKSTEHKRTESFTSETTWKVWFWGGGGPQTLRHRFSDSMRLYKCVWFKGFKIARRFLRFRLYFLAVFQPVIKVCVSAWCVLEVQTWPIRRCQDKLVIGLVLPFPIRMPERSHAEFNELWHIIRTIRGILASGLKLRTSSVCMCSSCAYSRMWVLGF